MLSWMIAACIAFSLALASCAFAILKSVYVMISVYPTLSRLHFNRSSTYRRCNPSTTNRPQRTVQRSGLSKPHLTHMHALLRFQLLKLLFHAPELNVKFLHLVVPRRELLPEGGDVVGTADVCEVGLETWREEITHEACGL